MTTQEMMDWVNCGPNLVSGNLVNWENAEWMNNGREEQDMDREEICKSASDNNMKIFSSANFDDSVKQCKNFGAVLASPDNITKIKNIIEVTKNQDICDKELSSNQSLNYHILSKHDNEQRKILIEHNMEIARLNNWAKDNPELEKQWMYR